MTDKGSVRANTPVGSELTAGRGDAQTEEACQSVPLLQLVARGHPAGDDEDVRFPLSLRNVEDLLAERGIDICLETVRFW